MRRAPALAVVALGLAVAVGLGTAAAPWASSDPDGLERVAEDRGFLGDAAGSALQDDSPVAGYGFPGVEDPRLATGLAGFTGTLAVFLLGLGVAWLLRRRARAAPAGGWGMGGVHLHVAPGPAGDLGSRIHRLDPRAKIIGLGGVAVVAVTTPLAAWPAWVACAGVLAAVAVAARVPPGLVWRRSRVVLPLVLAAALFIPFAREGTTAFSVGPFDASREGLAVLAAVAVKAAIGTAVAVLLGATTPVPDIIRGLEALRVPRIVILVASFMHRYLLVVAGELVRMRAALAARAYRPRHLLQLAPLGRMAAALFLRSHARGERVYLAMQARGFTGGMPREAPLRLARADAVFVALLVLALVPLRAALAGAS